MCSKSRRRAIVKVAVTVVCLSLPGCGGDELVRQSISGTVSLTNRDTKDKPPTIDGSISFFPSKGQPGPAASANIVDGRYVFSSANGPLPGKYRVAIRIQLSGEPSSPIEPAAPKGKADRLKAVDETKGQGKPSASTVEFETDAIVEAGGTSRYDFSFPTR